MIKSDRPVALVATFLVAGLAHGAPSSLGEVLEGVARNTALATQASATILDEQNLEGIVSMQAATWAVKDGKEIYRSLPVDPKTRKLLDNEEVIRLFDGQRQVIATRVTDVKNSPVSATYSDAKTSMPSPLSFGLRINGQHMGKCLEEGRFSVVGEGKSKAFGRTVLVGGEDSAGGKVSMVVAPERGWTVVRTEWVNPERDGVLVYDTQGLRRIEGLWLPTSGTMSFSTLPDRKTTVSHRYEFNDIKVGAVPDKTFQLDLPAGSLIKEGDQRAIHRIGSGGEKNLVAGTAEGADYRSWMMILSVGSLALVVGLNSRGRKGKILIAPKSS